MNLDGLVIDEPVRRRGARSWQTPALIAFGVCFLAATLPYALPLLSPERMAWFGLYLAEALVIVPILALLIERTLSARRAVERSFWLHWSVGMGAWASVWIIYPFLVDRWADVGVVMTVELLYVIWYGAMFVAAIQFDDARDLGLRGQLLRLEKIGLVILGGALVASVIIVPQVVNPDDSGALLPHYVLYQLLDWALVALYAAVAWRVSDPHWRRTLWLVTGALLTWGLLDLIEAWIQVAGELSVARSMLNVLWLAPYPFLAAAMWHDRSRPAAERGAPTPVGPDPTAASITPLLGATLLALAHLLIEVTGVFVPETLIPRSLVIAVALVLLLALAWEHSRVTTLYRERMADELLRAQKLAAVSSLAGGLAHDLRNLTTVISGNCDLLEEELEDASAREQVEDIRRAANETYELMQRLLTLGRQKDSRVEAVDLNAIVLRTLGTLKPLLGRNVEVVQEFEPELPGVRGDVGRLEQIVLNLVLNARDAMPKGGTVTVRTEHLPAADDPQGGARKHDEVAIVVADTGRGIDPAVLARIFDPYFTTKAVGHGTGLGLSTVQAIVAQHGGRIDVDSVPDEGTTFRVVIPLKDS